MEEDDKTEPASLPQVPTDWFLQQLVSMVNSVHGEFEIPITLSVGGILVSGQLSSGDKYFAGMSEIMTPWFTDESARTSITEMFSNHMGIYKDEVTRGPPQYVHLRDARFFSATGGGTPTNGGVWWRGRIQQVDGISIGVLEKTNAS